MGCCNGRALHVKEDKVNNPLKANYLETKQISSINDIKLVTSNLLFYNKDPFNMHYKVLYSIGGGSFGKVYKCKHLITGQERALKVIKLASIKETGGNEPIESNIIREIEILAQLDHPNIMKVFEYFTDKYNVYIAMELMEGGDLYEFLNKIKTFSEIEAALIMKQLLSSVHYIHTKGIVHRDLKPENIVIESNFSKQIKSREKRSKTTNKKLVLPVEIKLDNINGEKRANHNSTSKKDVLDIKSKPKSTNLLNINTEQLKKYTNSSNYNDTSNIINENIEIEENTDKTKYKIPMTDVSSKYKEKNNFFNSNNLNNNNDTSMQLMNQETHVSKTQNSINLDGMKSDFSNMTVKIIDFGASSFFLKNKTLKVKVGTPYYIAPEVLNKSYNQKCDIWSLGVILYILLSGKAPFEGKTTEEIFKKILDGKFSLHTKYLTNISEDAKDLISKMLIYNYKDRPSALDCLQHRWITTNNDYIKNKRKSTTNEGEKFSHFKSCLENLRQFSVKHKFQQATIAYLIRHVANKELFKELKEIFEEFDTNGDGTLSYEEVKAGFEKYYSNQELANNELNEVIKKLDQDQNDCIEYEEFLRNIFNMQILLTKENLQLAFEAFDKDGNGVLTPDEIKDALGVLNDEDEDHENVVLKRILDSMDANGDGSISFDEFYDIMMKIIT